jgi:elongation factor Ts
MAEITAQMVKDLREKSGAGMMDCKKALTESAGDMQKAMNLLRERGAAIASKRSSRATKEGLVCAHIAADRKTGGLIELNCESDFVARNDDFKKLSADFALHVAGLASTDGYLQSKLADGTVVADAVQNAIGKIGENIAFSRCERIAAGPNGFVHSYIHPPGKIGVLVEVAAPVGSADNSDLAEFAHDVAMHIAATAPICVSRDEVPSSALDTEKEIFRKQALNEGKPEKIVDKIVEGRVQKYYAEVVLLEQPFAKNPDQKVSDYQKQCAAKVGGDLAVKRFVRFRLGERAEEGAAE